MPVCQLCLGTKFKGIKKVMRNNLAIVPKTKTWQLTDNIGKRRSPQITEPDEIYV